MDRNELVDEWADALLEANRSAPARSASIEDDLFAEARRRNRERQATFAKAEAIMSMIGVAFACAFGYALLNTF